MPESLPREPERRVLKWESLDAILEPRYRSWVTTLPSEVPSTPALAVFGGSFDPPHAAHALVPPLVMHATGISRVIVTPTYSHALQKGTKTSFEHRLRMTQLAMRHLTGVEVSPIEAELGGTSRTYHTLEALSNQNPSHRIYLVIGADILGETHRWYRWDDITSMATPFVVGRAGYPSPPHCPFDLPEISSTAIRGRLAGSLDTQGLLAPQVAHYISAHGLYRDEA